MEAGLDATPWETVEPFPDIHALFELYNGLYFNSSLGACSVEWSSAQMVKCAGICCYGKGGAAIRLSAPLLKYRPAIDLKETLLHEMIHAYIYLNRLKGNNGDPHGPLFHQVMHDINTATFPDPERPPQGYHLSKYHTFLEEVRSYQTHHWRCDKCGLGISRHNNRAPQVADCRFYRKSGAWSCNDPTCRYHQHQNTCGGTFTKIGEPDGFQDGKGKKRKQQGGHGGEQPKFARSGEHAVATKRPRSTPGPPAGSRNILDFLNKLPGASPNGGASSSSTAAGPSSPPPPVLAPGVRRINDSPADRRQLLAEAAQRRMEQQQQEALQAPDQAPAGASSVQGRDSNAAGVKAEPDGGNGSMHASGIGAGVRVEKERAGNSSGDAILLDSGDEEQQRPAASGPVKGAVRSDSAEARFAWVLSGAAGRGAEADRSIEEGAAGAMAAGGIEDATVFCPVCQQHWPLNEMPNAQLNAHIDQCLLG